MNEPRKAGRPRKHLQDDHHFKTSDVTDIEFLETSTDATTEGAPPVAADVDQAGAIVSEKELSTPAVPDEVAIDNPITDHVELPEPDITPVVSIEDSAPVSVVRNVKSNNFWNSIDTEVVLKQPPRNGMPIYLSEIDGGEGILGFWKRTRAFNGKRYEETGKWVDFQSGMSIPFQPNYWKERF